MTSGTPATSNTVIQDVQASLTRLDEWIRRNGWAGYDPYDIKGHPLWLRLSRARAWPLRVFRRVLFNTTDRLPMAARKLLGVRPAVNAKAMGLFVSSYVKLARCEEADPHLGKARECATWLLDHPSKGYSGLCWGYPFDWQSKVFIPKGTPSSVVSATVADGLWAVADVTGDEEFHKACKSVCEFFVNDLNVDEIDRNTVCFSYTPIDDFHVHNANLMVAEMLARVGSSLGIPEYVQLAVRAGNYALREQRQDGSLYYWGECQDHFNPKHRDCYHTGFETRALWGLWQATGDKRFRTAAVQALDFFYDAYIRDDGAVWLRPDGQYPVDVHACAEALLCTATLREAAPDRFHQTWPKVLAWVVAKMQNRDGTFAYRAYANGRIDRTPYLRWGQAWMLRALSEILVANREAACGSG